MTKKAQVCEPLKDGGMLRERIEEGGARNVLLIFWHGIGDLVMFMPCYRALVKEFPGVFFTVGVPKGLGHQELLVKVPVMQLTAEQVNDSPEDLPFDLVSKITFPMNEGQDEYTKAEFCCIHELGIEPVWGHGPISQGKNRLVAVHFQITCLPDSCNPDRDTAEKIWNEILDAGFIPIEVHFEHVFHNPVNTKFDFIDSTVRRCRPQVSSLTGLLSQCAAFIGVVSGPFHCALSLLGPERVLLLEKDFKAHHFTKHELKTANLKNYTDGDIKKWLDELGG